VRGFRRGVRQVSENVQVVERGEGPGKIGLDEFQRPAPGLQADFDEDPRALADVVARRLDEPGGLAQLRNNPPRALRLRRIGEQRLAGKTRPQGIGVYLGVAFPGADGFEVVQPGIDVRRHDRALHFFHLWQERRVDLLKASAEAGKRAGVRLYGRTAEILALAAACRLHG